MAIEASKRSVAAQGQGASLAALLVDGRLPRPATSRSSSAARGPTSSTRRGKRYLDMLSGLFTVQIGYSYGDELGQAALEQMRSCRTTRTGRSRTRRRSSSPRSSPRSRRRTSTARSSSRAASEAVESAWKLARQYHAAQRRADAPQGDLAQGRLPRHDDGRALDHRHHVDPHALRAADRRRAARREHEPLPLQVLLRRPASARSAAPTRWPRRSSTRAPRPSRWSSWSPCRTRAARSRRTPTTTGACARSATTTACCRSPTRSSARSGASASGSAASATTTSPT